MQWFQKLVPPILIIIGMIACIYGWSYMTKVRPVPKAFLDVEEFHRNRNAKYMGTSLQQAILNAHRQPLEEAMEF